MGPITLRYGYDQDEIDQYARVALDTLIETGVEDSLILLALCRAITIMASEEELDIACLILDEMRELSIDDFSDYDNIDNPEDDDDSSY